LKRECSDCIGRYIGTPVYLVGLTQSRGLKEEGSSQDKRPRQIQTYAMRGFHSSVSIHVKEIFSTTRFI
jgi:hypothetical protein